MADNPPARNNADSLHKSNALKEQGNQHFRTSQWHEAIAAYRSALDELPRRIEKKGSVPTQFPLDSNDNASPADDETECNTVGSPIVEHPAEANECAKARAVLNANIGACYVRLADHQKAVEACSQALYDDPNYVKALQRRAASNENINSWSSLTAAQEDYNALLKLLPPSSSQTTDANRFLLLLKPRIEAAQKRETAEMFDKLKGLGNSVLGNFGLSTDNFKFEPNGQGGYSVNFSR